MYQNMYNNGINKKSEKIETTDKIKAANERLQRFWAEKGLVERCPKFAPSQTGRLPQVVVDAITANINVRYEGVQESLSGNFHLFTNMDPKSTNYGTTFAIKSEKAEEIIDILRQKIGKVN
ncbi:MAG: hypothetical protein QXT45_07325, partial [Candidatus Bilamarchaeaceae archaeon]